MKSKILFVAIFAFLNISLFAQNYNDVLRLSEENIISSARALGMGNAFSALSNDASGFLFNPAGIALVKKGEFDFGLNINGFNNSTTFMNNLTKADNFSTKWNQFGIVLPVATSRGSLSFGFGYNVVNDFNKVIQFDGFNSGNNSMIQDLTDYNDDVAYNLVLSYPLYDKSNNYLKDTTLVNGKLNQSGKIKSEGDLRSWSFSAGIEIDKDVFFGGTISILNGEFKRVRDYFEDDTKNYYSANLLLDPVEPYSRDFLSFNFTDRIDWDISGYQFKLGILGKLNENITGGFTIQFPRVYTIKETYSIQSKSEFANATYTYDIPESKYEYDIQTPYEYDASIAYKKDNYTLAAEAKIIDYSSATFSAGFDKITREEKNKDIGDLLKTVINFNVGGEYYFPAQGLAIRAGFMLKPSAFDGDPSVYNKKYITAGLGYKLTKKIQLDAAYAYGWWKDFGDNYGSNISRTYQDMSINNFLTSVKFYF